MVIENKDFEKLIQQYDRPNTIFYLDPPYYETEDYYEDVGFGKADHERLCNALMQIKGKFLLSYNDCPQIRQLYSREGIMIESTTRLSNIAQRYDAGKQYPELLISNYDTYEEGVLARHRVIIVGIREDLPYEFKIPSTNPYRECNITCKNAIENPPIPQDALNNEKTAQSAIVVERLKHIKPGQNAFTADLPEELQLNVRGAKISQIYKRLDPTKPAYTVTGSGGGGTHIYHWSEPRALTNRERARLQTFPDTYYFQGSKESVRKQIGMAVPCQGAKIIFEAILKTFAGIPYESMEPNLQD